MGTTTKAAGKRKSRVTTRKKAHTGHATHMCELVRKRDLMKVGKLSRNAKYICNVCGRAAAKATNLCEPTEI